MSDRMMEKRVYYGEAYFYHWWGFETRMIRMVEQPKPGLARAIRITEKGRAYLRALKEGSND